MKSHHYSFFGQKSSLILSSADWSDPSIYFRFLKKKDNNDWEKPSRGEGKNIKFNLGELVSILEVFQNSSSKWTTVHRFKGDSTPISIENKGDSVVINIPGYSKFLRKPEYKLLGALLEHIFEEKIIYATGMPATKGSGATVQGFAAYEHQSVGQNTPPPSQYSPKLPSREPQSYFEDDDIPSNPFEETHVPVLKQELSTSYPSVGTSSLIVDSPESWLAQLPAKEDALFIEGDITARSPKAVAFQLSGRKSNWIPNSCILNLEKYESEQGIWVKRWFVEKKAADLIAMAS